LPPLMITLSGASDARSAPMITPFHSFHDIYC
jgi:hypothetical protein